MGAFEEFAEDWDDIPEDTGGILRPFVWCLAEAAEVKATTNDKVSPAIPQLEINWNILESATSESMTERGIAWWAARETKPPAKAFGRVKDWLSKPPKGHPGVSEKARNFQAGQFGKAISAALVPTMMAGTRPAIDAARQVAQSAGGFDVALAGKHILLKLGVNDGTDSTGVVKNEDRNEKPMNRVDSYMAATPENVIKYVRR